jgi:hypothetical protein
LEEEKSPASKPGNKPRAKNAENAVTKSKPKSVRENGNAKADMAGQKREPLFTLEADIVQGFLDEFPEDKDAKKIVKALPYVDPGSQETWLHVGMALKGRWGDSGWDLFDEWSGHGDGYDEDENSKRWDSFSEDAEGGIGLGTVFKLACENRCMPSDVQRA